MTQRSKGNPGNPGEPPMPAKDPTPGIFSLDDPELHRDFLQRLERDHASLQRFIGESNLQSSAGEEALNELSILAHQLYGTAAMFGMKSLSAAAGALQQTLQGENQHLMGLPSPDRLDAQISLLIDALDVELKR